MSQRRNDQTAKDLGARGMSDGQDAKHQDLQRDREVPDGQTLTTDQAVKIADNQNSLRAGTRGPTLLEDFILREKITQFDHERIPERVVHARGAGAHGYFELYEPMTELHLGGVPARPGRQDAGLRAVLDGRRLERLAGHGPRRSGLRGQVLHAGRRLRHRREQHPGLLHPGCDQVPGRHPCGEAGAAQRDPAGGLRPRHVLGLHLAHPRIDPHGHVGDVRPGDPAQLPDGGCPFQAGKMPDGFRSYAERIDGQKIRERSESFRDHFSQATLFWNSQSEAEQEHIVLALQFELGKVVTMHVRERIVDLLTNVDMGLARRVAAGIGVTVDSNAAALKRLQDGWERFGVTSRPGTPRKSSIERSAALSMANTIKDTVKTRKVAILAANGVDGEQLTSMKSALTEAGAVPELISPAPLVKSKDGTELKTDKMLLTTGSVIYDAVYVPGGKGSAETLKQDGDAIHFVNEAFKHCKAIGATGEGVDLLLASSIVAPGTNGTDPERRLMKLSGVVVEREPRDLGAVGKRFMQAVAQHRAWDRQTTAVAVPVPA